MSTFEHTPYVGSEGSYQPDNLLISGSGPTRGPDTVTIAAGQANLVRGTVLGTVTATGEYKVATSAANDGSQDLTKVVVLAASVDTTGGAEKALVYTTGEFNARRITLGTGVTLAALRTAVRPRALFFRDTVPHS